MRIYMIIVSYEYLARSCWRDGKRKSSGTGGKIRLRIIVSLISNEWPSANKLQRVVNIPSYFKNSMVYVFVGLSGKGSIYSQRDATLD